MCAAQKAPVDMLMYYDARPTPAWNGMFDMMQIGRSTLKGYYPFPMFNALYGMKTEVASESDDGEVYALAARDGEKGGVILCRYNDEDGAENKEATLSLGDLGGRTEAEFYLLDEKNDLTFSHGVTFEGKMEFRVALPNFTSYLVLLKRV
jgi:hypothetical protein